MRFTMVVAIGVLGCGKVNDPLAGDAAAPVRDAGPSSPDAMVDSATPSTMVDAMPSTIDAVPETCGNGVVDLGEDCDGSDGCPVGCHVVPPAGSVALRFTGKVTVVDDKSTVFSGRIVVGTEVWGRVVYPTNLMDTAPSTALGEYRYNDIDNPDATGLWITIADWQFTPARGSGVINVGNGLGADPDGFYAQHGNGITTPQVPAFQSMNLNLIDPSRTALTQDGLPRTSFPDIAAWETHTAGVAGDDPAGLHWYVQMSIDQLMLEVP